MTARQNYWQRFLQQILLLVLLGFTADAFTHQLPEENATYINKPNISRD